MLYRGLAALYSAEKDLSMKYRQVRCSGEPIPGTDSPRIGVALDGRAWLL
jgi:hypothetical protein